MQLFGGVPNLLTVRQWVKNQILNQCQGQLPRLKPDLPPQVSVLILGLAGPLPLQARGCVQARGVCWTGPAALQAVEWLWL